MKFSVLPAGTSSSGSSRGTSAPLVGEDIAKAADWSATRPSSTQRLPSPSSACTSRAPVTAQAASEAEISSVRRSTASDTEPP